MPQTSKATLLLTRPAPSSAEFLAACEARLGRRIPYVQSPLIEIRALSVPSGGAETVVLTSGNAVRVLGNWLKGRRVATVGQNTAALAQQAGADAVALGETGQELLENAGKIDGPVLVCRGVHARLDLAAELENRGVPAREAIVYDQVARNLTDEAKSLLTGDRPVVAPVFSPRSAALLSDHAISAPLTILAISSATAEAWKGDADIRIAESPTAEAMSRLVAVTL